MAPLRVNRPGQAAAARRPGIAWLLALLLALPAAPGVLALPGDRDQPIHITADKALRDEVQGVTVYTGNVHLVQGSMELDADKLTIYHNTDVADEIIAEGRPAKMRQQPEVDEGIVHAHALVITYFKNEDRVHLESEARIEQDGSVVEGDEIDYLIEKQIITAQSDESREDNKVVVVIPPSMHKQGERETDGEATPDSGAPGARPEAATTTPGVNPEAAKEEGVSGATESE